ncbi:beta-1,3-N-acetylglucosaminyltransferase radical fringe-like [Clavelina lepadiformis]|uniref:beta-1,3-N-acetylglucosaminyltransferase radical fringe-like n=1 Tax=Clavelina lepadiformis TaxID=159417 RepID=UPI004041477F
MCLKKVGDTVNIWLLILVCFTIISIFHQLMFTHLQGFAKLTEPYSNKRPHLAFSENIFQKNHHVLTHSSNITNKVNNSRIQQITLEDVFISVKSTKTYHRSRLSIVYSTWFKKAAKQTYIFTDYDDPFLNKTTDGHVINTNCSSYHTRKGLSCKMEAEYNAYMKTHKKWWCHFDDDNYVNIKRLVAVLNQYHWKNDMYIGKPSMSKSLRSTFRGEVVDFWFATGGAGFCITNTLATKMSPWCRHGNFSETSKDLHLPDDCTVGFIITNRLTVHLTHSELFHSHLERLNHLNPRTFADQVTFSYNTGINGLNVISIPSGSHVFNVTYDPTRFLSLHCLLYPGTQFCPK